MAAVFAYRSPTQRTELLSLLADRGEQARVLAGGTDLLIDMRNGVAHPEVVVNLKNVEGFSAMSWSDTEGLIIRPGVTVNDVLFDARIRECYPAAYRMRAGSRLAPDPKPGDCHRQCGERLAVLGHGSGAALSGSTRGDLIEGRPARGAVHGILHGGQADGASAG